MKKLILATMMIAAFSFPSFAIDVTVTIPAGAVIVSDEICETVRLAKKKPITMTKKQCLQLIVNDGMRRYYLQGRENTNNKAAKQATSNQVNAFDLLLFDPLPEAFCGDGILDLLFGDECDDGNNVPGDGCDAECNIE